MNKQSLELHFTPDFQSHQMIVTGDLEVVQDVAAVIGRDIDRSNKVLPKLAKTAVEAVQTPQVLVGRTATVAAKLFDLTHGTDVYAELQERRRAERLLAMKLKLGLLTANRCAKHERLLAKV